VKQLFNQKNDIENLLFFFVKKQINIFAAPNISVSKILSTLQQLDFFTKLYPFNTDKGKKIRIKGVQRRYNANLCSTGGSPFGP